MIWNVLKLLRRNKWPIPVVLYFDPSNLEYHYGLNI